MLAYPVALEHFEPVARRHPQVQQLPGGVKQQQFAPGRTLNRQKPSHGLILEEPLGVPACKAAYHPKQCIARWAFRQTELGRACNDVS